MLVVRYYTDEEDEESGVANATVRFKDDASLYEDLLGFVRVCKFAGYYGDSFNLIIKEAAKEIDDNYSFEDFLIDRTCFNDF